MSLATLLREATWASHQSAEARPWQRALARGEAAPEPLGRYLAQLRLVHRLIERCAAAEPALADAIGWDEAMIHSRRLDLDLHELGAADAPALPATKAFLEGAERAIRAEPTAWLGHFYVLEGSMNGNRFLARALKRGPAAARCRLRYFEPYGERQPERWAAARSGLDRLALDPGEEQAVVAAALAAFEAVAEVSEQVAPPPAPPKKRVRSLE